MNKNFLKLLLSLTFIKGLLWVGITPIFQSPDEPLHYAHTQYKAEQEKYKIMTNMITEELYQSLKYLETEKVAYESKIKQKFSNSLNGLNEKKIQEIKNKDRKNISNKNNIESQNPPFYYFLGSFFYKISPVSNLIWRVFFLRIYSVICFVLTIYFSYKAIILIFSQKNPLIYIIPSIISFLPMVSYITSVINNDNLFLLLVTIIIYLIIKDVKEDLSIKEIAILGIVGALAFLTRQNFIPVFFVILITLFINNKLIRKRNSLPQIIIFTIIFIFISGCWYLRQPVFKDFLLKLPKNILIGRSHFEDLKEYSTHKIKIRSIPYTLYLVKFFRHGEPKKIFNYFWGTFGCLDTRLPRIVYYLLFIFCAISFFGFLRYLWKIKNKFKENLWIWEMIFLILFFSFSMSYYEWRYYQVYQDYFLQGRYFFPLILPIVIFLVLGWHNLFPKRWQNKTLFILSILMIVFNSYCLFFIMIPRYYSATSLIGLVIQLSQYKPEFLKGIAWPIIISIYVILVIKLIVKLYQLSIIESKT